MHLLRVVGLRVGGPTKKSLDRRFEKSRRGTMQRRRRLSRKRRSNRFNLKQSAFEKISARLRSRRSCRRLRAVRRRRDRGGRETTMHRGYIAPRGRRDAG